MSQHRLRLSLADGCPLTATLLALLLAGASHGAELAEVPYGVPAKAWRESFGKHRARVYVEAKAQAVRVRIPWRRRDHDAEKKRIIIVDATTNKRVDNMFRVNVNREFGDLVFEPATAPGEYHVYCMPYIVQRHHGGYGGGYQPRLDTADKDWLRRCGLSPQGPSADKWKTLPAARVLEIQARTEFSRFDPMEVVATRKEHQGLLARHAGKPYLLFPEDRKFPIRMREDLPLRWIKRGPRDRFEGKASRNEFYAFQIGLYAVTQPVDRVTIEFQALRREGGAAKENGPGAIPASAFRCFNLGGTNWDGRPLRKTVSVAKGKIQPLWCGVQIPKDAPSGLYKGRLTVAAKNAPPHTVDLALTVTPQVLEDSGDGDLWRHARLRWLDSTIGMDDEVVAPYTPLEIDDCTVKCLGRSVRFAGTGLPESVRSGDREILAGPMTFVVETKAGTASMSAGNPKITKRTPGTIEWESPCKLGALTAHCSSRMEFDGHLTCAVTLTAGNETQVDDLRLEIPFQRSVSTYMMGVGRKGGYRPKKWSWKWGGKIYYDSFWIGDVWAGMQCELRGASYCGPMVNLYWALQQLKPPATWHNGGKGGVRIVEDGDRIIARCYSGPRRLAAGQRLRFEFALLITPVKPLDPASHFKTRYYHHPEPVEKVAAVGANVINVHHANELNPYINYPFLANDKLAAYVRAAHEKDIKVKIYYTLRELTNHVVEMWALRSLGHEVLAPGGGGGYPWLREHLVDDYAPMWYAPMPDGEACAAIVNSGMSRWYNYYLEGLAWLCKNIQIDGLYQDDVSYDRQVMKRVRKILDRLRPGSMIDLHSNTAFSKGPANQYMEFFPYVDRLWFGESFNYDDPPDYWLVEICGIPYGLMGEMLQNGGNKYRGMIYGMTARAPWNQDPPKMWPLWDRFGIAEAKMIGYWEPACPVRTDHKDVLATAYVRPGKTLIALASWHPSPATCRLQIDWNAIGLVAGKARLFAPAVEDFQAETIFKHTDGIPVAPGKGWLLIVDAGNR